MPVNITNHGPITYAQSQSQKAPFSFARPERAGMTFKQGTPVQPYTTGGQTYVQAWDGATVANAIWGISYSFGLNLPTNGAGAPSQFGPVGPPKAIASYGSVPNQSAALNIAIGTPVTDGRTYFMAANSDTIFQAVWDNSNGAVAADYTPTSANEGIAYGLTIDANGFWFIDASVTGANAICKIVGQNPDYGYGFVNGQVRFKFIAAAQFDN